LRDTVDSSRVRPARTARRQPGGTRAETEFDDLNERIGEAVLTDGRVYVGTTRWAGKVAFRPAFVN
jgi:hypothetical protein